MSFFFFQFFIKPKFQSAALIRMLVLFLACFICNKTALAQLPVGFIRERIAVGLNPTSMNIAPDGRIFIIEKQGKVRIVRNDVLLDEPLIQLEVDHANERGLGHMVLDPDFDSNGFYYLFYAVTGQQHNRISRFTAAGDKTIPGSELVLLNLDPLGAEIHNGGSMAFGFDGYLYVATGDGGESWMADDLQSTQGKILRLDKNGNPAPGNPWDFLPGTISKYIYAYGFRNPFSMSQDAMTGELYANDVGGSKYEEINKIESGAFYGWPIVEGLRTNEVVPAEYKDPVLAYDHTNNYCCIVGSAFYSPSIQQFPQGYLGKYFYSDYCTGHMHVFNTESNVDEGIFVSDGDRVVDIEIAEDGSLYYLERKGIGDGSQEDNTSTAEGTLWKVTYTGNGLPFITIHPESILASVGESATFHVKASGTGPLIYTWYVNQVEVASGPIPSYLVPVVDVSMNGDQVEVEVTNALGSIRSDIGILNVTENRRPVPVMTSPLVGQRYKAGDEIFFTGHVQDPEDGVLEAANLNWRIDFHHGTHTHPAMGWTSGIYSGSYVIPSIGETSASVWYRIYLQGTDSEGLSNATYVDIEPYLGNIRAETKPAGLMLHLDGQPTFTPFEVQSVQGLSRFISAPHKQIFKDSIYFFQNWEDGESIFTREAKATDKEQSFTGLFEGILKGKGTGLTASYFNNTELNGIPVLVKLDSIVDHNYFLNPPAPGLPDESFSIQWRGYVRPYRSGMYEFITFSDDGARLFVNGHSLIDNWTGGFHREIDSIYLEAGRLYPIELQMFDGAYSSKISLRWKGKDFPEEVIPTSQLYPVETLSSHEVSKILSASLIQDNQLVLQSESTQDLVLDLRIINLQGQEVYVSRESIAAGREVIFIEIGSFSAGVYFLLAEDANGKLLLEKTIVKIK